MYEVVGKGDHAKTRDSKVGLSEPLHLFLFVKKMLASQRTYPGMKEPSVQQILQIVHHICLDTTAGVRHLWPVEYIRFKSTMKLQWRTPGVIHKHVVRTWSTVRATHAPSRSFSSDSSRASILKLIAWKKNIMGRYQNPRLFALHVWYLFTNQCFLKQRNLH